MNILITTQSADFVLARETNTTDSAYPTRLPQQGAPNGNGSGVSQTTAPSVFNIGNQGSVVQNKLNLVVFGTGADGTTLSVRILGWRNIKTRPAYPLSPGGKTVGYQLGQSNELWVPYVIGEVACTLSSGNPGIAGSIVPATCYFAKTMTLTTGNNLYTAEVISPAVGGAIAHAVFDIKGSHMIELIFETGSSATDCNALIAMY